MHQDVPSGEVTQLLVRLRSGEAGAADALLGLLYEEMHACARGVFASQRGDHTLQPTALVHEAWLKLAGNLDNLNDRRHFLVVATKAMRQVLTDYARSQGSAKRGGRNVTISIDGGQEPAEGAGIDLVALDDSLTRLAAMNARHARVVELRILGGLTIRDTAEALDISHGTVESDWAMAKAWLRTELGGPV